MGVPREQALRNRQQIVDTATRVFRERGVNGVGVADLMREAGFTHGGFYNHFASKDALAAEACAAAFAHAIHDLGAVLGEEANGQAGAFHAMLQAYLSPGHRDDPGCCCPIPTMATDAARQGEQMQVAYADGIEAFVQAMTVYFTARATSCDEKARARGAAVDLLVNLVGTIVLARGVGAAEPALSEEILAAGRARLPG